MKVDVSRNSRKIGPRPIPATPPAQPVTPAADRVQDIRNISSHPTSLLDFSSHRPYIHLTFWPFRSLRTLHSFEVHRCSHSFLPLNSTPSSTVSTSSSLTRAKARNPLTWRDNQSNNSNKHQDLLRSKSTCLAQSVTLNKRPSPSNLHDQFKSHSQQHQPNHPTYLQTNISST